MERCTSSLLSPSIRYCLSPAVEVVHCKGEVRLVGESSTYRLPGSIEAAEGLAQLLIGGASCTELAGKEEGQGIGQDLLEALTAEHFLIPADAVPETGTAWERQFGYLAARTGDPQAAQEHIRRSRVAIVGVGGVGGVVLQHLVGAGVRSFHLIDADQVEIHNLNRQLLYASADVGSAKVEAAQRYVLGHDTGAEVRISPVAVTSSDHLAQLLDDDPVDMVVQAADHPPGEIDGIVDGYCRRQGIPFICTGVGLERGYWGPLLVPGATCCVDCFERHLDADLSRSERSLKASAGTTCRFSFGPVNTVIAAFVARDLLDFLAGAADVASLGARLVLNFNTLVIKRFPAPAGPCRHQAGASAVLAAEPEPQKLVVEIDVLPASLAPGTIVDLAGQAVANQLWEPLFAQTSQPCEVVGAAAESAQATADSRCWRIRMRKGLSWSDGSPMTCEDAVRAIHYLVRPDTSSPMSWLADILVDGYETRCGKRQLSEFRGLDQVGDHELELRLTRPIAYLPALLTNDCFAPRHVTAEENGGDRGERLWSGPYRLAGQLPDGKGLILQGNRQARRWQAGAADTIVLLKTESPEQGIRLYQADAVHITANTTFPPHLVSRFREQPDLLEADMTMAAMLQLNPARQPILGIRELRQALALVVDRSAIAEQLQVVRPLWYFSELWFPDDEQVPAADPDQAAQLLRQTGIVPGQRLSVSFADFCPNREVLELVAEQVADVLGITIDLCPCDYDEYVRRAIDHDYEALYSLVPAAYDEPSSMLAPFRAGGPLSQPVRVGADYDKALAAAEAEPDLERRLAIYYEVNDQLLEVMPVIPLLRARSLILRKPFLSGVKLLPSGIIQFERIFWAR
jgi:ABC-type oligopeptide transport system substrate-binding subunit/molybdopterin/thiamine biosynthesis adenylyltransferase